MNITDYLGKVPYVTTDQMREVDRAIVEDFHIELIQMMENAGRNLAHLARMRFFDGNPKGKRVVVLAGSGGNGGGAMVCARRLHNWGAKVQVFVTKVAKDLAPVTAHQLDILKLMQVPVSQAKDVGEVEKADLLVDGIIGYSLSGAPRGAVAHLIRWANNQKAPILALDTPSGMDTTTGKVFDPSIKAAATLTLALPKTGFLTQGSKAQVGELYLADIGVPPDLFTKPSLGFHVDAIFAQSDIVRLKLPQQD